MLQEEEAPLSGPGCCFEGDPGRTCNDGTRNKRKPFTKGYTMVPASLQPGLQGADAIQLCERLVKYCCKSGRCLSPESDLDFEGTQMINLDDSTISKLQPDSKDVAAMRSNCLYENVLSYDKAECYTCMPGPEKNAPCTGEVRGFEEHGQLRLGCEHCVTSEGSGEKLSCQGLRDVLSGFEASLMGMHILDKNSMPLNEVRRRISAELQYFTDVLGPWPGPYFNTVQDSIKAFRAQLPGAPLADVRRHNYASDTEAWKAQYRAVYQVLKQQACPLQTLTRPSNENCREHRDKCYFDQESGLCKMHLKSYSFDQENSADQAQA